MQVLSLENFEVYDIIAITERCNTHKNKCTKNYKVLNINTATKRLQLAEIDDDTSQCVFMGTHYCSSQEEAMDHPYLIFNFGKYALESEDHETTLFNLGNVKNFQSATKNKLTLSTQEIELLQN